MRKVSRNTADRFCRRYNSKWYKCQQELIWHQVPHPEYGHYIHDVDYRALTVNGRVIARVESMYDTNTFENMWNNQKG